MTFGGTLSKDEKGYYLSYVSPDYLLAWEFATYMNERYGYHSEIAFHEPGDKRRSRTYIVVIRGKYALESLSDIGKITMANGEIDSLDLGLKSKVSHAKDIAPYVRGVFLSVGSLTRASEGLRLELTFEIGRDAKAFQSLLKKNNISLNLSGKGEKYFLSTRKIQRPPRPCERHSHRLLAPFHSQVYSPVIS